MVVHGHHLFHGDYLPEIDFFARQGSLVFAYDSTGSGESEGACPGGQSQWTLDLHACLTKLEEDYREKEMYLFGHSTGAFAVCAVMNFCHPQVRGILACAPVNSGYDFGKAFWELYPHPSLITRQTYLAMKRYEEKRFGKISEFTALSGINQTNIPIVLIQCRDDKVVVLSASMIRYREDFKNPCARIFLLDKGGHWALRCGDRLDEKRMTTFFRAMREEGFE